MPWWTTKFIHSSTFTSRWSVICRVREPAGLSLKWSSNRQSAPRSYSCSSMRRLWVMLWHRRPSLPVWRTPTQTHSDAHLSTFTVQTSYMKGSWESSYNNRLIRLSQSICRSIRPGSSFESVAYSPRCASGETAVVNRQSSKHCERWRLSVVSLSPWWPTCS